MSEQPAIAFQKALGEACAGARADTWDPLDGVRYGLEYLCMAVEILERRVLELEAKVREEA